MRHLTKFRRRMSPWRSRRRTRTRQFSTLSTMYLMFSKVNIHPAHLSF